MRSHDPSRTFSVACMTDCIKCIKWANVDLESREDRQCSTRIHSIHIIGQNYRSFQAFLYFGLSESQTFVSFFAVSISYEDIMSETWHQPNYEDELYKTAKGSFIFYRPNMQFIELMAYQILHFY